MRTFLAVELRDGLRLQLAQVQQDVQQRLRRSAGPDLRMTWVQVSSMHLTLKFLGETAAELIAPLYETMAQGVGTCEGLRLPLERLGVFPRVQHPRVLWLGPSATWEQQAEARQLAALQGSIEVLCAEFGLPQVGKPFYPHLTVARIRESERHVGQALLRSGVLEQSWSLAPLEVTAVALLQSTLRASGAVYTKLWEIPLRNV